MSARARVTVVVAAGCAVALAAWSAGAARDGAEAGVAPSAGFPGQGENAALDDPAQLAWRQFARVNLAAGSATAGAGGDPAPVAWELWASAAEVFADPANVPVWPTGAAARRFEPELVQQRLFRRRRSSPPGGAPPSGSLTVPAHPESEAGEVRIERTAFDWIVLKQLWYLEGQQKAFDFWAADQPTDVAFPDGSVLVKAAWKEIAPADRPRFHWRLHDGRSYGLVALHIASKIVPGWFWATFEQVDNPGRAAVAHPDPFGLDDQGEPSQRLLDLFRRAGLAAGPWRHYRLNGTQTDFVGLDGAPVVLANSVIEAGFTAASSCKTCHARSTIGAAGARLSFEPVLGAPDPAWFGTSQPPVRSFLQLDFAWSLTRAKPRQAAPASAAAP